MNEKQLKICSEVGCIVNIREHLTYIINELDRLQTKLEEDMAVEEALELVRVCRDSSNVFNKIILGVDKK